MIFAPHGFLGEADEIGAGDTVMVAYPAASHAEDDTVRVVHVELSFVAEAMGFLVVDPAQRDMGAAPLPDSRTVLENDPWNGLAADSTQRFGFVAEYIG